MVSLVQFSSTETHHRKLQKQKTMNMLTKIKLSPNGFVVVPGIGPSLSTLLVWCGVVTVGSVTDVLQYEIWKILFVETLYYIYIYRYKKLHF